MSEGGLGRINLLVLCTPTLAELRLLDKLGPAWNLLGVAESLDAHRAAGLTAHELNSVEVLLLHRTVGAPIGGDRGRLQSIIPELPNLKWIHSTFAGVNHILYPELVESAVVVTNARGVFSSSLAEWALFSMSWFAKNVPAMQAKVRARQWDGGFTVQELRGRTLGVVGFGDIGRTVAKLADAYGMRVVAVRRRAALSAADPLLAQVYHPEELLEMLSTCDYVVMATPLTDETRGMFDEAAIAALRPHAVFINLGRGPCVDEAALAAALAERRIKGAALDVFTVEPLPADSPLWALDNVLISPHCADRTAEAQLQTMELFLGEAERYAAGEPFKNVIDKRAGY